MKIQILTNNITDPIVLDKGIALARTYLTGLPIQIDIKSTNFNFSSVSFDNPVVGKGIAVKPEEILALTDGTYDICCLVFSSARINPQPTNPVHFNTKKGNTTSMQIPCEWYAQAPEVFAQFFLHELCHCLFFLKGGTDMTHLLNNRDMNPTLYDKWGGRQPYEYYLSIIKSLTTMPPTNPTYKYFKPVEVVGLKPELVAMLDTARGIAGIPFIITSGLRTPAQNAALPQAVTDSSHLTGEAVDLLVKDGVSGGKILLALAQAGFKRFGFYKDGHIHCDIDATKPTPCYWIT